MAKIKSYFWYDKEHCFDLQQAPTIAQYAEEHAIRLFYHRRYVDYEL